MPGLVLGLPAASGSSSATASLYGDLSVLCDYCSSYSQEMDMSVADALKYIGSLAECKVSSRNEF